MISPQFKVSAAALIVAASVAGAAALLGGGPDTTALVPLKAGSFDYRQSGEYLQDGSPVNAPLVAVSFDRPVQIMHRQVSRGEYDRCVAAAACKAVAGLPGPTPDTIPVVGVNFEDATAYAAWLSRQTGYHYRLPTDAEWAYAAGHLFRDNLVVAAAGDAANPAARWIATYENESKLAVAIDPEPRPFGSFGVNESGLADVAGNVWEWTDTCFARHAARKDHVTTVVESCGVRVVEGNHRTYVTDFIRDPKGGACAVGTPPSNLGIRLIREDGGFLDRIAVNVRRLFTKTG
jgi:formylglycine-generating enzyme required for sulfatase activity